MRTAECAGAHGVIIGKNNAVGLTETVAKASAGAIEYVPVVKVTNLGQCIDKLKERGVEVSWIHFTHIENWYKKLGYETVLKWNKYGIIEEKKGGTC